MCVGGVSKHTCECQRRSPGIPLYCPPPYSFEMESLTESEMKFVATKPQSLSRPPTLGLQFLWEQTQTLMLTQVFLTTKPSLQPSRAFVLAKTLWSIALERSTHREQV